MKRVFNLKKQSKLLYVLDFATKSTKFPRYLCSFGLKSEGVIQLRFLGLEQVAGPQAVDKLLPREDGYAIDFAWAWFVGDEYAVAERALVADGAKPLEVVLRCVARRKRWTGSLSAHRWRGRRQCEL